MCIENLDRLSAGMSHSSTSDTFPNIPISSPKRGWPSIKGVSEHAALLNWPFGKNHQPTADSS